MTTIKTALIGGLVAGLVLLGAAFTDAKADPSHPAPDHLVAVQKAERALYLQTVVATLQEEYKAGYLPADDAAAAVAYIKDAGTRIEANDLATADEELTLLTEIAISDEQPKQKA